jgi:hypothetical protein
MKKVRGVWEARGARETGEEITEPQPLTLKP